MNPFIQKFITKQDYIFQDGNKRTALASCHIFLKLNEFHFRMNLKTITIEDKIIPSKGESSNEILIAFSLELADGKISLEECQFWIAANIIDSSEVIY